jgi:hypothetical protein
MMIKKNNPEWMKALAEQMRDCNLSEHKVFCDEIMDFMEYGKNYLKARFPRDLLLEGYNSASVRHLAQTGLGGLILTEEDLMKIIAHERGPVRL